MSTILRLKELEGQQVLHRFEPSYRGGERERRPLYLLRKPVGAWVTGAISTERQADLKARVRVHLGIFVKGQDVDDCRFMKRVEDRRVPATQKFDHDIWSISPRFEPQHRFFGTFALGDHFVVFCMQSRLALARNPSLWHTCIDKSVGAWDKLFPGLIRYYGSRFEHCVTVNGEHCDARWYPV
jgi:hypothetical protein